MVLKKYGLYAAWLLVCIGTLLSLYFSVIRNFEPCHLCWYQRIFLFPLTIILGIAAYQGNWKIFPYVFPFVALGLLFAGYQIAIQEIPGWNPIDMCGAGPSCSEKVLIGIGPITIPMLSFALFLLLGILLTILSFAIKKNDQSGTIFP